MAKAATIHFDGMCEPRNPGGWMGAGWVLQWIDDDGEQFRETGSRVWHPKSSNTNNLAEWRALYFGLYALSEIIDHTRMLTLYGDSQLVVNQFNGDWQCRKTYLASWRDGCTDIAGSLSGIVQAVWIPRENNVEADTLSRRDYAVTALKS